MRSRPAGEARGRRAPASGYIPEDEPDDGIAKGIASMSKPNPAQQVMDAIGAHGLWKGRFVAAIRSGNAGLTMDEVRPDDVCAFGRWLKHEIDPVLRGDPEYARIVELHAHFHALAGEVLETALRGGVDSETLVGAGSAYAKATHALTTGMMAWETKLLEREGSRRG